MGNSSSAGISFGFDGGMGQDNQLSAGGAYFTNSEVADYVNAPYHPTTNFHSQGGLPYFRCAMLRRSMDVCYAHEFTHDSSTNKCTDEREDYYNCIHQGKEHRFLSIWTAEHQGEQGERQLVKYLNHWDRMHYDQDQGDILERAANVQKMYKEKGLTGQKWWGDRD
eukprot:Rhum_TRINITY_DN2142_c0_g1::Rhum_TRINITY_DN2142_c0_g1_i1::g.5916::m.5916